MIKFLIQRPIAVFMAFTAFFILGIITYLNIPVSLLPNIAIPEITVHVSGSDYSSRELENRVVSSLRRQLQQVGKLRDVRSWTRDGHAVIRLDFEFGTDIDLAFIEVNEKIDAAMTGMPRGIDRPRVVKASATDIPIFQLSLTLRDEVFRENDFLDLCEFSANVLRRRIEQLPQVALVDVTGMMFKQVLIQPDMNMLKIAGMTLSDIESALSANNIEPGNMTINDGHYEYSVKFSSVMRTVQDMQNIYIRKNEKIYQLKELASVSIAPAKEHGMAYFNGNRAIIMSMVKQADENIESLKNAINVEIDRYRNEYPGIDFQVSQNQTELLDYTIGNLQRNLMLAFAFIMLVSVFFMRDVRSPLIIGLSMFVSLVISLLFFYLFNVSLNIISLTGLILALGMMIDNSIIVTDNIGQYRKSGYGLDEACVKGTNEVITPMLSSVFTTISVFLPLVFLSGIAGAVFADQAFSVAVGLLVSYVTGIMLLPVSYKLVFGIKSPRMWSALKMKLLKKSFKRNDSDIFIHERFYHHAIDWFFAHKKLTFFLLLLFLPLCYFFFSIIDKEKMPQITQTELVVNIEWNENINIIENSRRVDKLLDQIKGKYEQSMVLVGRQQYLLTSNQELSSSEAELYLKMHDADQVAKVSDDIEAYVLANYPDALIGYSPPLTIFEKIFNTADPELIAMYFPRNEGTTRLNEMMVGLEKEVQSLTNETPTVLPLTRQLDIFVDRQKIVLYGASYNDVYRAIRTIVKENRFAVLRSYQQFLPVVMAHNEIDFRKAIDNTLIHVPGDLNGRMNTVPLSTFVNISTSEDVKTIVAGLGGEHIPFYFFSPDNPERIINVLKQGAKEKNEFDLSFAGTFFANRQMIAELGIVLIISIILMYFILAAQFESFVQPLIVLLEIPIDIAAALGLLLLLGHSLNLMSAIGIVVTCGIIINDSILKVDVMNQLRKEGMTLMGAIHEAGRRRLNAILLTSLTTIVCMLPILFSADMGSELEKPLAIATIGGMLIGTPVSLFVVPLAYWLIYRNKEGDITSANQF